MALRPSASTAHRRARGSGCPARGAASEVQVVLSADSPPASCLPALAARPTARRCRRRRSASTVLSTLTPARPTLLAHGRRRTRRGARRTRRGRGSDETRRARGGRLVVRLDVQPAAERGHGQQAGQRGRLTTAATQRATVTIGHGIPSRGKDVPLRVTTDDPRTDSRDGGDRHVVVTRGPGVPANRRSRLRRTSVRVLAARSTRRSSRTAPARRARRPMMNSHQAPIATREDDHGQRQRRTTAATSCTAGRSPSSPAPSAISASWRSSGRGSILEAWKPR